MRLVSILSVGLAYCSLNVQAQDPWLDANEMLRQAVKRYDPIKKPSSLSNGDFVTSDATLYIPMDYYSQEQERLYSYFWSHIANSWQKQVYELLKESSEKYNNAEATFTLAQLHLWGYYDFPHNKTLAFQYSEKFNDLTNSKNSTALFDLSVMYSTGLFGEIPIDIAKALVYLQKSASLGNLKAKQALAYKYYSGTNVPRDCNKALLIYREIAEEIRRSFDDEQWYLYPPHLETYNLRIPDFSGGLLGKGLSSMALSTKRVTSERPDIASSFLTKMDGSKIWLHFGSGNGNSAFTDGDDESDDRLVDIYYTAIDEYKGTYMKSRDSETARKLLEITYETFDDNVPFMNNLQRYYYAKCLDLLGHIYFTGEAEGKPNIKLAETYLKRSIEIIETYSSITSRSHIDLGLIAQYIQGNDTKAINHYKIAERFGFNDGRIEFQLSQLTNKYPNSKLGDPFILMQAAYLKGLRSATYEYARMTEMGVNDRYSCEDTAYLFKSFIEGNEDIMAPQLRLAYGELLKENGEVALWAYAQAAEQGYEAAQVSAAYILYQLPHNFEDPPRTLPERKLMAISYYVRAFKQGNIDAGVVAGDIYYRMQDYHKAVQLYQSTALKFSPQALWDLGYMYEHGLGVDKDYYMAKRYYDQVLENNSKLYVPVKLSVMKLRCKIWLSWLAGHRLQMDYINENDPEQEVKQPWYKRFIKSYKDAFKEASGSQDDEQGVSQKERSKNSHNGETIEGQENSNGLLQVMKNMGFRFEDFMSIFFILSIFLFSLVIRVVARARGWNVRGDAPRLHINGQAGDEQRRANFQVQIFAI